MSKGEECVISVSSEEGQRRARLACSVIVEAISAEITSTCQNPARTVVFHGWGAIGYWASASCSNAIELYFSISEAAMRCISWDHVSEAMAREGFGPPTVGQTIYNGKDVFAGCEMPIPQALAPANGDATQDAGADEGAALLQRRAIQIVVLL